MCIVVFLNPILFLTCFIHLGLFRGQFVLPCMVGYLGYSQLQSNTVYSDDLMGVKRMLLQNATELPYPTSRKIIFSSDGKHQTELIHVDSKGIRNLLSRIRDRYVFFSLGCVCPLYLFILRL